MKHKRYLRTAFVARGNIVLSAVLCCIFFILFFVFLLSSTDINPLITIIFPLIGMIFLGYVAFDTSFYFIDGSKIRMSILGVNYKSKPCVDINYVVVSNAEFAGNNPTHTVTVYTKPSVHRRARSKEYCHTLLYITLIFRLTVLLSV